MMGWNSGGVAAKGAGGAREGATAWLKQTTQLSYPAAAGRGVSLPFSPSDRIEGGGEKK